MPSRTTHNTTIEVLWTVLPVLILVAIAIPSFRLLYKQYSFPPPGLTIKAIGHTWNWTHEFPDQGISVDSVMLQDDERAEAIKAGMPAEQVPRNLAVDNEILVPVDKVVHVLVTSTDVIHNWTIPSFGSKVDAVPGRVTATWFQATKEGIYFGQCSELCGKDHAFMPIAVRVVKEQTFNDWAAALKARDRKKAREIIRNAAVELAARQKVADATSTAIADGRPRRAVAHESRSLSGGADRNAKVGDMATRLHAEHAHGHDHEHTPYGIEPVAVLDEPQGHRHDVPAVRHRGRPDRRLPVGRDAHGAAGAGPAVFRQRPHVQRVRHRPRPDHGVLHGHAGHDRRLRQLVRAAA